MAVTSSPVIFSAALLKFGADAEKKHARLVKAVAMRGLKGVVMGTRVDTGRARGNWQVAEGEPPEGFDLELKDKPGGATMSRGRGKIEEATGRAVIWIHNGVPYVKYLEDWDKMVEGTYQSLITWIRSQA